MTNSNNNKGVSTAVTHGMFAPSKKKEEQLDFKDDYPVLLAKFTSLKMECSQVQQEIETLQQKIKADSQQRFPYDIENQNRWIDQEIKKNKIPDKTTLAERLEKEMKEVGEKLSSFQVHKELFSKICGEAEKYIRHLKQNVEKANNKRNASKELNDGFKFKDTNDILNDPAHYRFHNFITKEPVSSEDRELSELLTKLHFTKKLHKTALLLLESKQLSPLEKIKEIELLLKENDTYDDPRTVKQILSHKRDKWNPSTPAGETMVKNIEKALADAKVVFKVDEPAVAPPKPK